MGLTPDDLRKRIPQWSLESDGHLLQYMVQISKNLQEKCKQTQDNFNNFLLEVDESYIQYANATNAFNGVQQVKYVENRVKDDDESFYSVREQEVEKDETKSYSEIFQMAVENSVANMYKCFEKVTVQLDSDSDSDDDDEEAAARNTVLRAVQKYPYISRPLPYIIGSQKWREKWHVGLIDSEEETDSETKQQFSDSSDSDGMFPSQTNSNHTPSESEGSVWGVHSDPRKGAPSVDPSVSGDDTLSIHSAMSTPKLPAMRVIMPQYKVPVLPAQKSVPPPFSANNKTDDMLSVSSKSKVSNLFEDSDEDSTPIHKPSVQPTKTRSGFFSERQAERKSIDLFADEPPPIDRLEPAGVQQRKPVNLFIESDEENDSFNNNSPSKVGNIHQGEPPALPIAAKHAADGNSNGAKLNISVGKNATANIFDDVNNNNSDTLEEDDLFVSAKRSINGGPERKGVRRITNLFDDDPTVDDFDEIFKPKAVVRKTADSNFAPPKKSITHETKKQEGQLDFEEKAKPFNSEHESKRSSEPGSTSVQLPVKTAINLFDDDDDNDLFVEDTSESRLNIASRSVPQKKKINLFEDDDEIGASPVLSEALKNSANETTPGELVSTESTANDKAPIKNAHNTQSNFSIRSEILKKKSIFESDSDGENEEDGLFESRTILKHSLVNEVPVPAQRKSSNDSPRIADKVEASIEDNQVENVSSQDGNSEKYVPEVESQISVEPPEVPPFEDHHQEDLHVSNDIDYYLTSYEVSGSSKEISSSILIDSKTMLNSERSDNSHGNLQNAEGYSDSQLVQNHSHESAELHPPHDSDGDEAVLETNENASPETAIPTVATPVDSKLSPTGEKSALSFNPIGLFDDVPPPDDDFEEHRVSSTVDQNEDGLFAGRSSVASNGITQASGNLYFFMDDDGPPPDDDGPAPGTRADQDQVDDSRNMEKLQEPSTNRLSAVIAELHRNELNCEETKQKPKPNKLNTKVNINVNALLPGARRIPTTASKQGSEPATIPPIHATTDQPDIASETSKQRTQSESASDKLIGLNKGRARIQVKRKPSSRLQRRTNYEKTATADSAQDFPQNDASSSISTKKEAVEEVRIVVGSEVKVQHVEITDASLSVHHHLLPTVGEKKLVQSISTDNKKEFFGNNNDSSEIVVPKEKGLFSDEESDGDDLFGKGTPSVPSVPTIVAATKHTPQPIKPPTTVKPNSLFDDTDDDDDLFAKSKKSLPQAAGQSSNEVIQKRSIAKKSIFGSDEESDGDGLFGSTKKTKDIDCVQNDRKPFAAAKQSGARAITSTKSLFGDDEDDDDDDLFRSNKKQLASSKTLHTSGNNRLEKNYAKTNDSAPDDPLADLLGS